MSEQCTLKGITMYLKGHNRLFFMHKTDFEKKPHHKQTGDATNNDP